MGKRRKQRRFAVVVAGVALAIWRRRRNMLKTLTNAMDRYAKEANRLYGVIDRRLAESKYLAGGDYTIADMAVWPWTRRPERVKKRTPRRVACACW